MVSTDSFIEPPSKTKSFLDDFEMLLQRQLKLENEALSTLSTMDCSTTAKSIGRISKSDTIQLVWNMLVYLQGLSERVISEQLSRSIYDIIANFKQEIQYAQEIKLLLQTVPKEVFLHAKSFTGHIKRYNDVMKDCIDI
jgi:hypothetical protein